MEILYFKSNNCGACKRMYPVVEEICADHGVKLHIYNYEDHKDYFIKHNVQGLPTVIKMENSKEIDRLVGLQPASRLDVFIGG